VSLFSWSRISAIKKIESFSDSIYKSIYSAKDCWRDTDIPNVQPQAETYKRQRSKIKIKIKIKTKDYSVSRSEIRTAALIKIQVSLNVMQCRPKIVTDVSKELNASFLRVKKSKLSDYNPLPLLQTNILILIPFSANSEASLYIYSVSSQQYLFQLHNNKKTIFHKYMTLLLHVSA
jgi:hypothetical protein